MFPSLKFCCSLILFKDGYFHKDEYDLKMIKGNDIHHCFQNIKTAEERIGSLISIDPFN